ncbi:hypothetical protein PF008_g4468 [Phytophthora fragariae]|uniref:Uncharacterized protein n=2 Tax=Phytophthora fragariae TaxID=53985 RepID=A0A6G0SBH1_9STRA|nr:hypothetical protein PF008_g4468 [Phytophthora fragariae]
MPSVSDTIEYFKEYNEGADHLSIQTYAVSKGDRLLLVDDVRCRHPPCAAGGRLRRDLHLRDLENFRIRVFPVLGTMSELFGQSMVACVLDNLAGKKINPEVVARLLRGQRIKLYQKLQQGEHVLFHENHKIEPEKGEIKFVYREIWWGRSSIYSQRPVANGADPHGRGQNISGEQFRADALIYDVRSATISLDHEAQFRVLRIMEVEAYTKHQLR